MERTLSPTAGVHDAEDDYGVRFAPVLDDVVAEVVRPDVRLAALDGMPDVRKPPNEVKGIIEDLVVDIPLS